MTQGLDVTEIRNTNGQRVSQRYSARIYGAPRVGQSLVLFPHAGNSRIVTSPVVRVLEGEAHSCYVQTRNTLYVLEEPRC